MRRTLLKSKIHRATVTQAELHYDGSVSIDSALLAAANILPHERVEIYDVTNGSRLATYAIEGPAESGTICINGAAARLIALGDLVIICSYAEFEESELDGFIPQVIHVDTQNCIVR